MDAIKSIVECHNFETKEHWYELHFESGKILNILPKDYYIEVINEKEYLKDYEKINANGGFVPSKLPI
jgi:hypothetical protein